MDVSRPQGESLAPAEILELKDGAREVVEARKAMLVAPATSEAHARACDKYEEAFGALKGAQWACDAEEANNG